MLLFVFTAASAPTNVLATAISATTIRLTWSEPVSFNGILHDYKIRLKLVSDDTYGTSVSVGQQMNYTVKSLRLFMDYELQVKRLHYILTCLSWYDLVAFCFLYETVICI